MKITRQEIYEGASLPSFYYGLAYWKWDIAVFYPIPFNYIVRFFRAISFLWDRFRSRPGRIDKMIFNARKKENERINRLVKIDTREQFKLLRELVEYDLIIIKKLAGSEDYYSSQLEKARDYVNDKLKEN